MTALLPALSKFGGELLNLALVLPRQSKRESLRNSSWIDLIIAWVSGL